MNIQLHPEILKLDKRLEVEANEYGVDINYCQRIYEYEMLKSQVIPSFNKHEESKKILRSELFIKYKRGGDCKTDKLAEAMAITDELYRSLVDKCEDLETLKIQVIAKINYWVRLMEDEESKRIALATKQKYSAHTGEGA